MDNCPHCGVSLIGDPIPEDRQKYYSPPYFWRREIGVELPEKYDGVWYWQCPDCKGAWSGEVAKLKRKKL
jgi:hypothetical protein